MPILLAVGLGLLAAGLLFVLTGSRATEDLSTKQAIVTVGRVLLHVVLGVGFAVVLASLDPGIASVVTLLVAAGLIGWRILRMIRSPSTARTLLVLAATLGLSIVFAAVLGMLAGGDSPEAALASPAETSTDPTGDCACGPAFDLQSIATDSNGTVLAVVGGEIPQGATYWLWTASDPLVPIEIIRDADGWSLHTDPRSSLGVDGIIAAEPAKGFHVRFGSDLGAVAITSAQGDRAPDSGYTGGVATDEGVLRFQQAYPDLSPAERQLGAMLISSSQHSGTVSYDVGISADLGDVRSGTLTVEEDRVEFAVAAIIDKPGHTDAYTADGDVVCIEEDAESCTGLWMNPFAGVADLLGQGATIDVIVVEPREVLDEEALCIAITEVGASALHLGEFCGLSDGTIAFVDDRTAGFIAVLRKR